MSPTPEYERIALQQLLELAKEFFRDPENQRGYEQWTAKKEVEI